MSNSKMLIDAAHPEETRVVVLKGNRVEEFDFESASRKQLRGNIYLAKVTRVEPSLQAAFVEYGGNRHGFLAFSEIHPDYYQIPFADRQALLEEEARAHRDEEDEPRESRGGRGRRGGEGRPEGDGGERSARDGRGDRRGQRRSRRHRRDYAPATALDRRGPAEDSISEPVPDGQDGFGTVVAEEETAAVAASDAAFAEAGPSEGADETAAAEPTEALGSVPGIDAPADDVPAVDPSPAEATPAEPAPEAEATGEAPEPVEVVEAEEIAAEVPQIHLAEPAAEPDTAVAADDGQEAPAVDAAPAAPLEHGEDEHDVTEHEEERVEQIGGDALSDVAPRPVRPRRHYKIQEVIKRRQILLVQVVKEERGNKGAALTTYLSLAGRYSVLMPNTAKGGGISRKITDGEDRKRLKSIAGELDVPEGMGVILRTAGASRAPVEVRRDFEYLLRMWESVRELTLKSSAPTLVYEEGSLIKRTIRDLYSQDIGDIVVSGEAGFAEARDFMRMLMPGNANTVQPYRDPSPIFAKSGVEAQLDAMFSSHVTLKSGGYLVINQTEALVAIDVNSGRSTREHNIEDTALRTNLEAADEVARQLRLRDLAGLIVVDFIDMEEGRNNRSVERRLKDALKNDRARIQIGHISHFGLLEMSRQRMRTGVLEGSTVACPHCAGTGTVRSTSSIALHVLRLVEDALIRDASYDLVVRSRAEVALYMLNQKRAKLVDLEGRFGVTITVAADPALTGAVYHAIERGDPATPAELPPPRQDRVRVDSVAPIFDPADEAEEPDVAEAGDEAEGADVEPSTGEGDRRRKRRRRRRGGRDRDAAGEAAFEGERTFPDVATGGAGIDDALIEPVPAIGFTAEPSGADEVGSDAVAAGAPLPTDDAAPVPAGDALSFDAQSPVEAPPAEPAAEEPASDEAPKRRRPRRTARAEKDGGAVETAAEETPKRRRSRRTARNVETDEAAPGVEPAAEVVEAAQPAADVDVGADTAERHTEDEPSLVVPAESTVDTMAAVAETLSEPAPQPEPDRPKRSGWWQRAKSSFGA